MGRILNYIEKNGNGVYHCYQTQKVFLETTDFDILNYDDKPVTTIKSSKFAETDPSRVQTVTIRDNLMKKTRPIFSFFLDGSRRTYKVDDISIGKKIFPFLAGQIVVGCCERIDRDTFKPFRLCRDLVMALPDDFDYDDEGENFCRLYCEKINDEISHLSFVDSANLSFSKILLYNTDKIDSHSTNSKDSYKNRAVSAIQTQMTDKEQELVAQLCAENRLDSTHYLIKDGSLEYNPDRQRTDEEKIKYRQNFRYVIGVSKSFDPELIPDFEGHKLSRTIAGLKPHERTKVYRYKSEFNGEEYAVWYLRLRNSNFRETNFSDIIKCEMVILNEGDFIPTDLVDVISANLINEAFPVCYGADSRWANHLYPVYLTETFCKSKYYNTEIILNLF